MVVVAVKSGCPWRLKSFLAVLVYSSRTIVLMCVSTLFHHWTTHLSFPTTWLALSWMKRWQRSAIVILLVVVRCHPSHPMFLLDIEVVSFPALFLWQEWNANAVDMNSQASLQHRTFHHLCWLTALSNHCSVCSFVFVTIPGHAGRARCCHAELNSRSRSSHSVCTFNPWKVPIALCKYCDAFLEYVCREKCSSGQLKCEIFLPTLSTACDGRVRTEHYCVSWLLWHSLFFASRWVECHQHFKHHESEICRGRPHSQVEHSASICDAWWVFHVLAFLERSFVSGARRVALCNEIPLCGLSPVVLFLKRTSVLACHWGKLAPHPRSEYCWAGGSEHVSYCMTHELCAVFSREITRTQIGALDPSLPCFFFNSYPPWSVKRYCIVLIVLWFCA